MVNSTALSITDIRRVATIVTNILAARGLTCCLVGSSAGHEHGITRIPNDVDVLVMTDEEPEELKSYLASADSLFYRAKPATNPHAAYRVLWYSLSSLGDGALGKNCRVDLFTPGMIHLPQVPNDRIIYSGTNLPIMPFFPIVLHKVQAWKAHLASTKPWASVKQQNDIRDVNDLLAVAMGREERLENQTWLEKWFLDEAVRGVQEYIVQHPETARQWARLGFPESV